MRIILILLVFCSLCGYTQRDTSYSYYKNGHIKTITPKLDTKPHGNKQMWYENGEIWSNNIWTFGKITQSTTYYESGIKSSSEITKKNKIVSEMWYPNSNIWEQSKIKFNRSIVKQYDSTGLLTSKTIYKKGSPIVCATPMTDSIIYPKNNCSCYWGFVQWKDGVFIDDKGRDVSTNFYYKKIEYYPNGEVKKVTNKEPNSKSKFNTTMDEYGQFITVRIKK